MKNTKLIIVDGIPGSGKSTTSEWLSSRLSALGVSNRFYYEMENGHPLRIYDKSITSLEDPVEAAWFADKVTYLFRSFVDNQRDSDTVSIVEAYVFQDTICFAHMVGMEHARLYALWDSIKEILVPLDPHLVFFQQGDVERNWRWICNIRGDAFTQGRCGIYTDEDLRSAGEIWTDVQNLALRLIDGWTTPKLVIKNYDYCWEDYLRQIECFLEL